MLAMSQVTAKRVSFLFLHNAAGSGSPNMRNNNNGSGPGAMVVGPIDSSLAAFRWVTAFVAVLMSLAIPARCSAQTTLDLASDSSYSVFENGAGQVNVSSSNVQGNLDMSGTNKPNISSSNSINVKYDVQDLTAKVPSNGTATTVNFSSGKASITGSTGMNVFNVGNFQLSSVALTLVGTATSTFIFNISSGMSVSSAAINLSGGLLASHVIFDVTGGGISVSSSSMSGTLYTGSNNNLNFSSSTLYAGALVAGDGGEISVSSSSILSASPFVAPAVASAPEMPTIMTAGLGAFLLMGRSGVRYLRRRRCTSRAEFTAH
jgi:hypothetical protein